MQKILQLTLGVFFSLGERAALVVLVLLAVIFLSMQSSRPAFSKDEVNVNGLSSEGKPPSVTFTPTPTPSPTPTPTPTPVPPTPTFVPVDPGDNYIWNKLADCETHRNWSSNTGNGYFGGLQFSQGAWESVGGAGNPAYATSDEQIARGKALQARRGWGAWNECAKRLGLN